MKQQIIIYSGDGLTRLDSLLASETDLSRSQIAKLIKEGYCKVNDIIVKKPSLKPNLKEKIELTIETKVEKLKAQKLPLNIIYEDDFLMAVDKPPGMVVYPGAGKEEGTLVNALLYHVSNLSQVGGEERPGIVHRLDKETSGAILIAKNDSTHAALTQLFKERNVERTYAAVVRGNLDGSGIIDKNIARSKKNRKKMAIDKEGREAITYWTSLRTTRDWSMLKIRIETGRTHQIRVHMSSLGRPILGDKIYGGGRVGASRLMLHAWEIGFLHPDTKAKIRIRSLLPDEFNKFL